MNQQNASEIGTKHVVWRHRGCGLCNNPAAYMCKQCRGEAVEEPAPAAVVVRSIIGQNVPKDFIYV